MQHTYTLNTDSFIIYKNASINDTDFMVLSKLNNTVKMFHMFMNLNVEFLPINLHFKFPSINKYWANNCGITRVYAESFLYLNELQEIHMNNNHIVSIAENAFDNLNSLEVVSFKNNLILRLHGNLFARVDKLTTVIFSFNNIRSLPGSIFLNVSLLDNVIFSKNQIEKLENDLFRNNKPRNLIFDRNKIKEIHASKWSFRISHAPFVDLKHNVCINGCYAKDKKGCFERSKLPNDLKNCTGIHPL